MSHTCHAFGCAVKTTPRLFMCRQHWTSLTPVLRKAINDDYTDGQDKAGNGVRPTPEWFTAAHAAIDYLKVKEAKPVQLKKIRWGIYA